MRTVEIEKIILIETKDEECEVSVRITGIHETGGSHAGFTEQGWRLEDFEVLDHDDCPGLDIYQLAAKEIKRIDWSEDFEDKFRDMKEAAAEARAGI